MNVVGEPPDQWLGLIDTKVPEILELVTSTWLEVPAFAPCAREDSITEELWRRLRKSRTASDLPFRIDIQMVELDPAAGAERGRMDIVFSPLIPREDIYFCLECKRLNATDKKGVRSYAAEYVTHGMLRFIKGQYASRVRHGGMLGYVFDRNINSAMSKVARAIRSRHKKLGMEPPGIMQPSFCRPTDSSIKETHHVRDFAPKDFCIHHLFATRA